MFKMFLNAFSMVVWKAHNKEMEYLNNPTPEVTSELEARWNRARKLTLWGNSRWGREIVGKAIYDRELTSRYAHRTG
jgi:hypothetical protein